MNIRTFLVASLTRARVNENPRSGHRRVRLGPLPAKESSRLNFATTREQHFSSKRPHTTWCHRPKHNVCAPHHNFLATESPHLAPRNTRLHLGHRPCPLRLKHLLLPRLKTSKCLIFLPDTTMDQHKVAAEAGSRSISIIATSRNASNHAVFRLPNYRNHVPSNTLPLRRATPQRHPGRNQAPLTRSSHHPEGLVIEDGLLLFFPNIQSPLPRLPSLDTFLAHLA